VAHDDAHCAGIFLIEVEPGILQGRGRPRRRRTSSPGSWILSFALAAGRKGRRRRNSDCGRDPHRELRRPKRRKLRMGPDATSCLRGTRTKRSLPTPLGAATTPRRKNGQVDGRDPEISRSKPSPCRNQSETRIHSAPHRRMIRWEEKTRESRGERKHRTTLTSQLTKQLLSRRHAFKSTSPFDANFEVVLKLANKQNELPLLGTIAMGVGRREVQADIK